MTDTRPDSSPLSPELEERVLEILEGPEKDVASAIEALCAEHREHAAAIRAMVRRSGESSSVEFSILHRIRERYGDEVDPDIQLPEAEGEEPGEEAPEPAERFEDLGKIDEGAMGVIHRLRDHALRRRIVRKTLKNVIDELGVETAPPAHLVHRFLEEAQVTGQLDHPNIVPVHDLWMDDAGRVSFTMKEVRGRTLKEVFRLAKEGREDWSRTRVLEVLLKVCDALAFAHSKGVLHRDVKPSNVMVGRFGAVYVMDWGLARVLGRKDSHDLRLLPDSTWTNVTSTRRDRADETPDSPIMTMDGDIVGTPCYMPPEQALGKLEELGPHSDVYAVGAMLYELLVGKPPYMSEGSRISPRTVLFGVTQGPPKPIHDLVDDVPAELEAITERAMARSIPERYPTTKELADDLRAFLEGRVVKVYGTGALYELRKWVQRNRALAASLMAAVVILVAGLIVSLVFYGRAEANAETARQNEMEAERNAREAADNARAAEANAREADANAKEATRNATEAERQAELAKQNLRDVLALSQIEVLEALEREANDLWPVRLAQVPAMEAWVERARAMEGRLTEFEGKLAELEGRALPWTEEERAADQRNHPLAATLQQARTARAKLDAAAKPAEGQDAPDPETLAKQRETLDQRIADLEQLIAGDRLIWRFPDDPALDVRGEELLWRHKHLTTLVARLRGFVEGPAVPEGTFGIWGPSLAEVERRIPLARTWHQRSLEDPAAQEAWKEAIAYVADPQGPYGFELTPQEVLVPLLPVNPRTKLLEFWDVSSGDRPEPNPDWFFLHGPEPEPGIEIEQPNRWTIRPETGAVFVLIPGGTFRMGAQRDPEKPNFDAESFNEEAPVHEVTLAPYFLCKYELTQAQWERVAGSNPATYKRNWELRVGPTNPVENVSWEEVTKWMRRAGWQMPSEAQWERGCRGSSNTPWWTGREALTLRGSANLADSTYLGATAFGETVKWPDGYAAHAPVGRFRANALGLHDVHGNVWEWCGDGFFGYEEEKARDGDGLRGETLPSDSVGRRLARLHRLWSAYRVSRGGGFHNPPGHARSAIRNRLDPSQHRDNLGCRPSRSVTP